MAESKVKDLLKYDREPPEDPQKLLPWLLDINEEFFVQELAQAVSILFNLCLFPFCINI